ncbi:MAG: hypothetical protein M1144_02085 [Candidatus Thermoplasmatota archaeon]|jgi:hypothetical protein|nr:hypothetical protein [Candidatus Thermoplasmatota archaeon]
MPTKQPKGKEAPSKPGKSGPKEGLSVKCVGDCGAVTQLQGNGDIPVGEMTFSAKGWSALNSPETASVSFICPECFKSLEEESDVEVDEDVLIGNGSTDKDA